MIIPRAVSPTAKFHRALYFLSFILLPLSFLLLSSLPRAKIVLEPPTRSSLHTKISLKLSKKVLGTNYVF